MPVPEFPLGRPSGHVWSASSATFDEVVLAQTSVQD
jgi:hypothetical protein